jgi:hypothetical protein
MIVRIGGLSVGVVPGAQPIFMPGWRIGRTTGRARRGGDQRGERIVREIGAGLGGVALADLSEALVGCL